MNTKLTLRMDDNIINEIKNFTSHHHISISKLTERLFENIINVEKSIDNELSPIAKKYKGILGDSKKNFNDLKYKYLKQKYE